MSRHYLVVATLAVALGAGCTAGDDDLGRRHLAITAYCDADVAGTVRDVETDYLPAVVNCENGGADFEALKVQAVAARTFLYFKLASKGSIGDGQGDQVYSCGREPGELHRQAVTETSGQVLQYQGATIAAFYVAGALQAGPDCTGGTDDPTGTEHYVTYNQGKSGADLEQTTLGFVDPSNKANRGCMGQNASDCLAEEGWRHHDILPFFYGADIELVQADGPCIDELPDDGGGGGGGGGGDAGSGSGGFHDTGCQAGGGAGTGPLALLGLALVALRRRR